MLHALTTETKQRDHGRAHSSQLRQHDADAAGGLSPQSPAPWLSHESARLRSMYGNQAILRMLDRSRPAIRRECSCGSADGPCTEPAACGAGQEATVHRPTDGPAAVHEAPAIVREVLNAPGQPLDLETQAFFGARFGEVPPDPASEAGVKTGMHPVLTIGSPGSEQEKEADRAADRVLQPGRPDTARPAGASGVDLSQIRVHTDARAAESARAVSALAYAVGPHIVFADGRYSPKTPAGQRLLAHELAHTIQQNAGMAPAMVQRTPDKGNVVIKVIEERSRIPVKHAKVFIDQPGQKTITLETDNDGNAPPLQLEEGDYTITVEAYCYRRKRITVHVDPGVDFFDLVMTNICYASTDGNAEPAVASNQDDGATQGEVSA